MFKARPGQTEVINYQSGKMGIAAVPGSGKTHTLSYLAARLVASEKLEEDQEILIVTLVNSAVDHFSSRVAGFLRGFNLLPGIGYRVRTLHGLANDIIREQPGMAGLDNHFSIVDERASREMLISVAESWKRTHAEFLQEYTDSNQSAEKHGRDWSELLSSLATSFIKQAKDYEITPEPLRKLLDEANGEYPLMEMGYSLYSAYQQALKYRGAVDFEDLIRLAYKVLRNNPDYLERMRHRWPIILEDEAQDSSMIQEKLLSLLCGDSGNWVRVGDPNQAIFETFTTANPRLLRDFMLRDDVVTSDLKYSGRSAARIIGLANYLNRWSANEHPVHALRESLAPPYIHPTPPGDPQPNPADTSKNIVLYGEDLTPEREARLVANSVRKWLSEHPDSTVAILVPRNARGAEVAEELDKQKVPFLELLKSSKATRDAAQILADILNFYSHPSSRKHLQDAVIAILSARYGKKSAQLIAPAIKEILKGYALPEQLFGVEYSGENSSELSETEENPEILLREAIFCLKLWQQAVLLPIDQTVMTIAMFLFQEAVDLALAHKLAVVLESGASVNPHWQLPDFCRELDEIAHNRLRLYGFSSEDTGFDTEQHKGYAVIATMHKAKGLEWDRVYLLSVNNYDFPSAQPDDTFMSEKWFVRDQLNLEAEMIAQLKALANNDRLTLRQPEGEATQEARLDYASERLRLLYVGITRARKELVITINTGRRGDCHEALPLAAMRQYMQSQEVVDED